MSKMIVSEERILSAQVDPYWETADVDTYNNHFPRKPYESRLDVYKERNLAI